MWIQQSAIEAAKIMAIDDVDRVVRQPHRRLELGGVPSIVVERVPEMGHADYVTRMSRAVEIVSMQSAANLAQ